MMKLNISISIIEKLELEPFHIYVMNNDDNGGEGQNKGTQL